MIYTIEPKPTAYQGVEFRSRLEAQWACMFDLCGVKWEYEPPIDLDGWLPDFALKARECDVFAEVKPTRTGIPVYLDGFDDPYGFEADYSDEAFDKAKAHQSNVQVMLLASGPVEWFLGSLMDPPDHAEYLWIDVHNQISPWDTRDGIAAKWKTAGNRIRR